MFEKIYLNESSLRKHLEAPLLKEREEFLSAIEKKEFCIRHLQITFYVVIQTLERYLNLFNDSHCCSI
jgi:hypothetical protein